MGRGGDATARFLGRCARHAPQIPFAHCEKGRKKRKKNILTNFIKVSVD
jgi:hypothetical protein